MAKKDLYLDDAERMYVTEQMTLAEIASRLSVSERTLVTWKAQGNWEEKRRQYLASRESFHEELYLLARDLTRSVREDLAAGKQVDAGRLYALTRLIPNMVKAKDYEEVTKKKEAQSPADARDSIVEAVENILGIRG